MVERIERREDVDDCACLECRGVDSVVTRRRIGDVVVWALGYLPSRPSIVLAFLALALAQFVGFLGPMRLEIALNATVVSFGASFAYCYAVAMVAGELSDRRCSWRTAGTYALRRFPTVIATTIVWTVVMAVLFVVLLLAAAFALLVDGLAPTILGVLVLLGMFCLYVVVAVKFVLASTAAVAGGYGPISSFRVSWDLVSFWRRTTVVLLSLIGVFVTVLVVGELAATTEPYPVLGNETVRLAVYGLSTASTFLSSAVSALVLGHLYVQAAIE